MRPRLLIVTTTAETLATILSGQPAMLNKSYDVAIAASDSATLANVADTENVKSFAIPMRRGISPFFDIFSILQMVLIIKRFSPDVIHSYTPKAGLVAMIAGWIGRVPIRIHTFTGLIFPTTTGAKRKLLVIVDRLICRCATIVVPESYGVKDDLLSNKITKGELKVIGHGNIAGVDTEYFSVEATGVKALSLDVCNKYTLAGKFVFCFVGRLNKDKGIAELYNAFKALGSECRLLILGGIDVTAAPPDHILAGLKSDPRVSFLGFQSDIRPYLSISQILVLPSYREGFPNVVLQALSMEVPVIVTNVSGSNEITQPPFNGWIVPSHDTKALYEAMFAAAQTDLAQLKEKGQFGRELVKKRHERQNYLSLLNQFYSDQLETTDRKER